MREAGIEKFFDILEEVKKEEQTTIETLFDLIEGIKEQSLKSERRFNN